MRKNLHENRLSLLLSTLPVQKIVLGNGTTEAGVRLSGLSDTCGIFNDWLSIVKRKILIRRIEHEAHQKRRRKNLAPL
jgi:hypothetical protein